MHYLYYIHNQINGKKYIGQSKDPQKRWEEHKARSKDINGVRQYVQKALFKYDASNFLFEIIATCKTWEDADEMEKQLIIQYDTLNPEKGYNVSPGGYHTEMSEETRKRISESKIGKPRSKEASKKSSETMKEKCANGWMPVNIDKISALGVAARKGKPGNRKGTFASDETKKKISEAGKGRAPHNKGKGIKMTDNQMKQIDSFILDGFSFTKIGEILGVNRHIISKAIKNYRKD